MGLVENVIKLNWFDRNYSLIAPAALAMDANRNFHILATAVETKSYCNCTKDWGRESNILILLTLNEKFDVIAQQKIGHEFLEKRGLDIAGAIWLPATEYQKSQQQNPIFMFTVGKKGDSNRQMVDNNVYSLKIKTRLCLFLIDKGKLRNNFFERYLDLKMFGSMDN